MKRVFPIRVPGDPTANPSLAADTLYALAPSGWTIVPTMATTSPSAMVLYGSKSDLRRIDAIEASVTRLAVRIISTNAADTDSLYNGLTAFRARGLETSRSIAFTGDATGTLTTDFVQGASVALSLPTVVAAGSYTQVTVDAKGRVTAGTFVPSLPLAGGTITGSVVVSSDATISSLNGGALGGVRNQVMNGCFRINARSAGVVTASGDFPCDRFRVSAVGGSRSVQRVALSDTDRTNIGVSDALFGLQYAATGGSLAGDMEMVTHGIENVRTFAGRTVMLSFYARRTAGTGNLSTELVQEMGSGGSPPSAVTGIGSQRHTLTTSWQRFTRSITIPALTGATLGSNGDDRLQLNFWLSAGSTFNARTGTLGRQTVTAQIALVQLEPGSVVTPFEMKSHAQEQHFCERFFQRRQVFFGGSPGAAPAVAAVSVTTPLRAAPTATLTANGRNNIATASIPSSSIYGAYVEYTATLLSFSYAAFDFVDLNSDY